MTKYLTKLIFIIFLSLPGFISGQGKEFWFAAPEVSAKHADRPIVLRIYTFDKKADVAISQPANVNFKVIKESVSENSFITIDLTPQIDLIETKPANSEKPLNTGLLIKSTSDINAYYEVVGRSNRLSADNSEIFVLKGNNALGTLFYIPMQTRWPNVGNTSVPDAWASFDIVASENNTQIIVTPTKPILGHLANAKIIIKLNKGQTYSFRALTKDPKDRPAGSKIESDKPISVTYKDDSVVRGSNYDLIGDQILPVSELGKEYIIIRNTGYILGPLQKDVDSDDAYILSIKNATKVYIKQDTITLNEGETFTYSFNQTNDTSLYIRSTEPVYLLHSSGYFNELGAANLLPLNCTGSKQTIFLRTNSEYFSLNILVRSGGETNFKLNGLSSSLITGFKDIAETNGSWKYTRIALGTSQISTDKPYILTNSTHNFHLSVLNGGIQTSFKYGYFSGFSNLNLGTDKSFCQQEAIELDAGLNKDSYLWSTGETTKTIIVKDTGTYTATTTKDDCSFTDEIKVSQYPKNTQPILGKDTSSCAKNQITIAPESKFMAYLWQDNSSSETYQPKQTGKYTLQVTDSNGCIRKDSLFFTSYSHPEPEITWGNNTERFCTDSLFTFGLNDTYKNVLWYNGETSHNITASRNETDIYTVDVKNDEDCEASASISIDCEPYISIPNIFTPNGDGINETFRIKNLKTESWNFQVHNRCGSTVYSSSSYKNDWKAENIPDGVYFYTLKNTEKNKHLKGWVQILR